MTNLWESYRDQASISIVPTSYSSEKGKEKELDVFDQIAQDLVSILGQQAKMNFKTIVVGSRTILER